MYVQLLRKGKVRQLCLRTTPLIFQREKRRAASGGTRTRDVLHVHVYISDMCVHVEDCTWRSSDASISQTEATTAEDPPKQKSLVLYARDPGNGCLSDILRYRKTFLYRML